MRREQSLMPRLSRLLILLLLLGIGGGIAFLMTWDIPSPTATIEIVVPNDRFPQ